MNQSAVLLQPAYILQHRKYRESSLIIDVLTQDFGVVSIIARGVRKSKSKIAGVLLAFSALKISYTGKHELKLLTHVELAATPIKLTGLSLYCSFYINELIRYFLYKHDPHPDVFLIYSHCLLTLQQPAEIEPILRFFELDLLACIGYGIPLSYCINTADLVQTNRRYDFIAEQGMVENTSGRVSGKTLLALEAREFLDVRACLEAKQLMRHVIDFQLQGKVLKSRIVLAKIMKQL